jgi:hypothetical protein
MLLYTSVIIVVVVVAATAVAVAATAAVVVVVVVSFLDRMYYISRARIYNKPVPIYLKVSHVLDGHILSVDLRTPFMCIFYEHLYGFHTNFHISSSSGPIDIAVDLEDEIIFARALFS